MSEFWQRKMRTYFKRIDFDKDGSITRKDFEGMAERFANSGKMKDEHKKDLKDNLTAIWDKYLSALGESNEAINQDKFIEVMKKLVNDPSMKSTLEGPLPLFFAAVDANDDRMISEDEFALFFDILGLDSKLAPESFKAIDENGDGQISLEEFTHAGSQFFLEEKDESSPTKMFWGPLI